MIYVFSKSLNFELEMKTILLSLFILLKKWKSDFLFYSMICFEEIVDPYKKIYDSILQFLEDENDSSNDEYTIKDIIKSLESPRKDDKNPILENPESFHKILEMISNISENHFRHRCFITKVQQILFHLQDKIKQTYSKFSRKTY